MIVLVATVNKKKNNNTIKQIVGHIIGRRTQARIELIAVVVDEDFRRMGVGSTLVNSLKEKLTNKRTRISRYVRETDLPSQLFFKHCKLKYCNTSVGYFRDTGEDGYLFYYRRELEDEACTGR